MMMSASGIWCHSVKHRPREDSFPEILQPKVRQYLWSVSRWSFRYYYYCC